MSKNNSGSVESVMRMLGIAKAQAQAILINERQEGKELLDIQQQVNDEKAEAAQSDPTISLLETAVDATHGGALGVATTEAVEDDAETPQKPQEPPKVPGSTPELKPEGNRQEDKRAEQEELERELEAKRAEMENEEGVYKYQSPSPFKFKPKPE